MCVHACVACVRVGSVLWLLVWLVVCSLLPLVGWMSPLGALLLALSGLLSLMLARRVRTAVLGPAQHSHKSNLRLLALGCMLALSVGVALLCAGGAMVGMEPFAWHDSTAERTPAAATGGVPPTVAAGVPHTKKLQPITPSGLLAVAKEAKAAADSAQSQADAAGVIAVGSSNSLANAGPASGLGLGLLCVLLSASRPSGVDHLTPLSRLLTGTCDRIAVYDADEDSVAQRSFPYADVVLRGPRAAIRTLVDTAARNAHLDKHRDPVNRIRWRTKESLDYAYALDYAYTQRDSFPFALVLEDDSWPEEKFRERIRELVLWGADQTPPAAAAAAGDEPSGRRGAVDPAGRLSWLNKLAGGSSNAASSSSVLPAAYRGRDSGPHWWAWTLFHCEPFDTRRSYNHGDYFDFKACTQGLLYRSSLLRPLIAFVKANHAEDPIDGLVRNYQSDSGARVLVAIPSVVQHAGAAGSTFEGKPRKIVRGQVCYAYDFGVDAPRPAATDADSNQRPLPTVVDMGAEEGVPADPQIRDRRK